MDECLKTTKDMLKFIEESPCAFHAARNLSRIAEESGVVRLSETDRWELQAGKRYYVTRNDSSIIAFAVPDELREVKGFHIAAAHSDSPSFKLKENPEMKVEGQYVKLNTEGYGGMIRSTWLDRPLSVAGRVIVKRDGGMESRLVNVDRDLLVIPNLAVHMNREINSGMEYNMQTDMLPLYGAEGGKALMEMIAEAAGAEAQEIIAHDLYLYVRQKGCLVGGDEEYVLSPRLDDLQCAFCAMTAFSQSTPEKYINMCVVFDNEEVGSGTGQGADSTFLLDVAERIAQSLGEDAGWVKRMAAGGLFLSADNAHAVHPNHPEKADPTNRPFLNGGIVIKYHGSQKYATDAITAAKVKELCRQVAVPVQTFSNRSDLAGGSTLGNISQAHISMPSVDIGLPQLAMHSAVETAGVMDTQYGVRMMRQFFCE